MVYYPRGFEVNAASSLRCARPVGYSDSGYYSPNSDPTLRRAPTPLMASSPKALPRKRSSRRPRSSPRMSNPALVATNMPPASQRPSAPGPGAYTPMLTGYGLASELSRPATSPRTRDNGRSREQTPARLQWERGPDGLLMPPASRSQRVQGRLTYVGTETRLLHHSRAQLLERASSYGDSIRMLPEFLESGIYDGKPARARECIPQQATLSEWWHLPRGERRPRGPSILHGAYAARPPPPPQEIYGPGY